MDTGRLCYWLKVFSMTFPNSVKIVFTPTINSLTLIKIKRKKEIHVEGLYVCHSGPEVCVGFGLAGEEEKELLCENISREQ